MEIYFDNSATTRCLKSVCEVMEHAFFQEYGNPSSLHHKGLAAERCVQEAAERMAKTLKVSPKELIFTSGGTEADNLAILGAAWANQRAGKHLITTRIEHPAVAEPMRYLEGQGFRVTWLDVDAKGRISLEQLQEAVGPETILVSIMQVNNEIGTVEPVEEAARIIKAKNANTLFHVDAIQSYGKLRILPRKMGVDLLSVSGHKIHGPKGVGMLYVKEKTKLAPIVFGGGHQRGLRSGTENVPGIAGLGQAAVEAYENFEEKRAHLSALREAFLAGLSEFEWAHVNGFGSCLQHTGLKDERADGEHSEAAWDDRAGRENASVSSERADGEHSEAAWDGLAAPHIVSVSFDGVRSEVLLHALEDREIYVSAGSACSSHKPAVSATLKSIGLGRKALESTLRFSFGIENTKEEVSVCLKALKELVPMLARYTRH